MASLAEAQSHMSNVPPEAFLKHWRIIRDAQREHEETGAAIMRAKKAAKASGIDMDALKLLQGWSKLDDDEIAMRMRHAFQMAAWLEIPLGTQASLFPDQPILPKEAAIVEQEEWAAGEAGYLAGKGGKLRGDNPFPQGGPLFVQWDRSFVKGLKQLAYEMDGKDNVQAAKAETKKAPAPKPALEVSTPRRGRGRPPANGAGSAAVN